MRLRRSVVSCVLVVVGSALAAPSVTAADTADWHVTAGAYAGDGSPIFMPKFYPRHLQVQQGDVVEWTIDAFSAVTFAPQDAMPAFLRGDETQLAAIGEDWAYGTGCGWEGEDVCVLDDTADVISSGTFGRYDERGVLPFRVRIDLPPGTYTYSGNVFPQMTGTIQVVAGTPQNPTAGEIAAEVEADVARGEGLLADVSTPRSSQIGGRRVWDVHVGPSTPDGEVALFGYFPAQLDVAAGDGVRFIGGAEFHSVTFPKAAVGGSAGAEPLPLVGWFGAPYGLGGMFATPACDFDDPATGLPGIVNPVGFCPAGSFELLMAPWTTSSHPAPGNVVATPATYHDSGWLLDEDAPDWIRGAPASSGRHLGSGFEAVFPAPGTYEYACTLHSGFTGAYVDLPPQLLEHPPMTGVISVD